MLSTFVILSLSFLALFASAHPTERRNTDIESAALDALELLVQGNTKFVTEIKSSDKPDLLEELTDKGQKPTFSFLGCSDSRVSEGTIFDAKPGTFFVHRNIANRYERSDNAASSFLAYGVSALGVQHVVVLGHYGCGGVQASIMSAPNGTIDASTAAVQAWIDPIRDLYASSNRSEIVSLREANSKLSVVPAPTYDDPGFRALIEENTKRSARVIYQDPVMINHYTVLAKEKAESSQGSTPARNRRSDARRKAPIPVFIHSWVYDLRSGAIKDLEYSFGPPGYTIPTLSGLLLARRAA